MQTVGPPAAGLEPTGEFINDYHFPVFNHIIAIAVEKSLRSQSGFQMMNIFNPQISIEIINLHRRFGPSNTLLGNTDGF